MPASRITSWSARRADGIRIDLEEKIAESPLKTFSRMVSFSRLGARDQRVKFRRKPQPNILSRTVMSLT